jgi:hypothetical protein
MSLGPENRLIRYLWEVKVRKKKGVYIQWMKLAKCLFKDLAYLLMLSRLCGSFHLHNYPYRFTRPKGCYMKGTRSKQRNKLFSLNRLNFYVRKVYQEVSIRSSLQKSLYKCRIFNCLVSSATRREQKMLLIYFLLKTAMTS